MQEADNAGLGGRNAEIDALASNGCHAQAGTEPFAGNARVANVGQLDQRLVDTIGEIQRHLQAGLTGKVSQCVVNVGASWRRDLQVLGARGRRSMGHGPC